MKHDYSIPQLVSALDDRQEGRDGMIRVWPHEVQVLLDAHREMASILSDLEAHCRVETPETKGNPVAHAAEGKAIRERVQSMLSRLSEGGGNA